MDEQRRLIKNTGIIALGNMSTKLVSFFLLPLYTSILSTAEYGTVDYVISISTFCVPFISMLMDESMFRFLIDCKTEQEKNRVISTSMVIILIGGILFGVVAYPVLKIVRYQYAFFLIAYVISSVVSAMMNALLRGIGRTAQYAICNFLTSVLILILNVVFIAGLYWGVEGMLLSSIIAHVLVPLIYVFRLRLWKYFDRSAVNRPLAKEMIRYSIPLIPNKLSWSIINLSDRIIIMNVIGSDVAGLYAVSHKFPNLMDTVYGFFYQSWKESSARAIRAGNPDAFYNKIYQYLKDAMYAVVLVMTAFMPLAFHVLINGKFGSAILYVPILLLGTYFANISGFYGGIFTAYKDTRIMGTTTIAAAAINFIVNIVLIWKFGLWAAALSTLIANLVVYVYRKHRVKKYIRLEENTRKRILALISTVLVLTCFYSSLFTLKILGMIISMVYAVLANKNFIRIIIDHLKARIHGKRGRKDG